MRSLIVDPSSKETALELIESQQPDVGPDEVLVKVKACGVNVAEEKKYYNLLSQNGKSQPVGHEISGKIIAVGSNVENLHVGTDVAGVLSLDSKISGCSEVCTLNQFDVVQKPASVSHEAAAASLGPGLAAYTAIYYLGAVTAGDTVLIIDGATPKGLFMITLAQSWGAKVIATYKTMTEKNTLDMLKPSLAQMIDLSQRSNILASSIMEETGGVGVDCVVDSSVRMFTSEEDKDLMEERGLKSVPHKYDILACMGFSARWITSKSDLQLDPPDSQQLFLRGASVSFLFPPAWTLMRSQHGRFQHILKDLMDRLENGDFKYNELVTVSMDKAIETLASEDFDTRKSYVVLPGESS